MKLNLVNNFKREDKCDVCGETRAVTCECEDCYFSGYDIDKQINKLQELKDEKFKGLKQVHPIKCAECSLLLGVSWEKVTCLIKCLKCSSSD